MSYAIRRRIVDLLSTYLELDDTNSQIKWSGGLEVQIHDTALKPSAFEGYLKGQNVEVDSGSIGYLKLKIPWSVFSLYYTGRSSINPRQLEGEAVEVRQYYESMTSPESLEPSPVPLRRDNSEASHNSGASSMQSSTSSGNSTEIILKDMTIILTQSEPKMEGNTYSKKSSNSNDQPSTGRLEGLFQYYASTFISRLLSGLRVNISGLNIILRDKVQTSTKENIRHAILGVYVEELTMENGLDEALAGAATFRQTLPGRQNSTPLLNGSGSILFKQICVRDCGLFIKELKRNEHSGESFFDAPDKNENSGFLVPSLDQYLLQPMCCDFSFVQNHSSANFDVPKSPELMIQCNIDHAVFVCSSNSLCLLDQFTTPSSSARNNADMGTSFHRSPSCATDELSNDYHDAVGEEEVTPIRTYSFRFSLTKLFTIVHSSHPNSLTRVSIRNVIEKYNKLLEMNDGKNEDDQTKLGAVQEDFDQVVSVLCIDSLAICLEGVSGENRIAYILLRNACLFGVNDVELFSMKASLDVVPEDHASGIMYQSQQWLLSTTCPLNGYAISLCFESSTFPTESKRVEDIRGDVAKIDINLDSKSLHKILDFMSSFERDRVTLVKPSSSIVDQCPGNRFAEDRKYSLNFEGVSALFPRSTSAETKRTTFLRSSVGCFTVRCGNFSRKKTESFGDVGIEQVARGAHSNVEVSLKILQIIAQEEDYELPVLLRPVEIKVIVSSYLDNCSGTEYCRRSISTQISPVNIMLSERRAAAIAGISEIYCLFSDSRSQGNYEECTPRLNYLAEKILLDAEVFCDSIQFLTVNDHKEISTFEKELLLEECLSDFLSQLSCYRDQSMYKTNASKCAMQLCLSRIVALGLTPGKARSCIENAKRSFVKHVDMIGRTSMKAFKRSERDQNSDACLGRIHSSTRGSVHTWATSEAEALDIIDACIKNAVEDVVGYVFPHLDESSLHRNLQHISVQIESVRVHSRYYTYDNDRALEAAQITVQNGAGVNFFCLSKANNRIRSFSHENASDDGKSTSALKSGAFESEFYLEQRQRILEGTDNIFSDIGEAVRDTPAIIITSRRKDVGYEFGSGGVSHPLFFAGTRREIEEDIKCYIHCCDVVIIPRDLQNCAENIEVLASILYARRSYSSKGSSKIDKMKSSPNVPCLSHLNGTACIDSCTILLASDNLSPFSQIILGCLILKYNSNVDNMCRMNVTSDSILLSNLTPNGEIYPDVLSDLDASDHVGHDKHTSPLCIEFTSYPSDRWNKGSEISILLTKVRLLFIQQFLLGELMQYTEKFAWIGGSTEELDKYGNPPPPLHFRVTLIESVINVPRNSQTRDVVELQAEEFVLFTSNVHSSWKMQDSDSSPHDTSDCGNVESKHAKNSLDSSTITFNSGNEVETWFDTVQEAESFESEEKDDHAIKSAYDKESVHRVVIQLRNFLIFTGLRKNLQFPGEVEDDEVIDCEFTFGTSKASHGKSIYNCTSESVEHSNYLEQLLDMKWEKVMNEPCSLEILIDQVSHKRVLIRPLIPDGGFSAFLDLDLRLSQFYLLLSLWFSNMQEMPQMFPYTEDYVENVAKIKGIQMPEYGTPEFTAFIRSAMVSIATETTIYIRSIRWKCSFDHAWHWKNQDGSSRVTKIDESVVSCTKDGKPLDPPLLFIRELVVNSKINTDGLVQVSCGANQITMTGLSTPTSTDGIFELGSSESSSSDIWAVDQFWGLDCRRSRLNHPLSLPFQLSTFLTTDGWCNVNVGIDEAFGELKDFSILWSLMDYFGLFFTHEAFGHPSYLYSVGGKDSSGSAELLRSTLEEETKCEEKNNFFDIMDNEKCGMRRQSTTAFSSEIQSNANVDSDCLNLDIRVWLTRPQIKLPYQIQNMQQPVVVLECEEGGGLFYRYRSVGLTYSSQEITVKSLACAVVTERISVGGSRHYERKSIYRDKIHNNVVENLNFCLLYSFDLDTNHMNLSFRLPISDEDFNDMDNQCSLDMNDLSVPPIVVPSRNIVKPVEIPHRDLGQTLCDIAVNQEDLMCLTESISTLIKGEGPNDETGDATSTCTYSVSMSLSSVRIFFSDPVLSMHMPIAVFCFPSIRLSVLNMPKRKEEPDLVSDMSARKEDLDSDFQATALVHLFADYFNNTLKCWEPFVEPYRFSLVTESNSSRGEGISVRSDDHLQINVTGALLETLDEAIESFSSTNTSTSKVRDSLSGKTGSSYKESSFGLYGRDNGEDENFVTKDAVDSISPKMNIVHQQQRPLSSEDRVAFSLVNMTGQRIRFHQRGGGNAEDEESHLVHLTYLDHCDRCQLKFDPVETVVCNLKVVERPFAHSNDSRLFNGGEKGPGHTVSFQVPGFRMCPHVPVDKLGRQYQPLTPQSSNVNMKINDDWKLRNALNVQVEVAPVDGGRQVSMKSLFEIVNNTRHPLHIVIHPTRSYLHDKKNPKPNELEHLGVKETYNIPLLLLEQSLELEGSHLGSVWFTPDQSDGGALEIFDSIKIPEVTKNTMSIGFNSCPIELSNFVSNSELMYKSKSDEGGVRKSGAQFSCPVSHCDDIACVPPFCYVVEIKRRSLMTEKDSNIGDKKKSVLGRVAGHVRSGSGRVQVVDSAHHGPLAYSFVVHAPIIIENLLPKRGTFFLMLLSKQVLWSKSLEPGESVPIHTVGLDAQLFLHIDLGTCQTPHGEPALVHEGLSNDDLKTKRSGPTYVDWNSTLHGVTQHVTNTFQQLAAITETPEERGESKFREVFDSHVSKKGLVSPDSSKLPSSPAATIKKESCKIPEHTFFSVPDCVEQETVIEDGQGQSLALCIQNIRGGGGQRHIIVYCPYWIVNTTIHSLRYRQESTREFVCGTSSPDRHVKKVSNHGNKKPSVVRSRPGERNSRLDRINDSIVDKRGTILNGTIGILADVGRDDAGIAEMSRLLNKDLPVNVLAKMCFMFNFLEVNSKKLVVQLLDNRNPKNVSGFSRGFGVESLGFTQSVSMHCGHGRALELSVSVSVPPGKLASYTKIVRFSSRYVIVNLLERPIRLWQDSSLQHGNFSATEEREMPHSDPSQQYEYLFGKTTKEEEGDNDNVVRFHDSEAKMPSGTLIHSSSALYIATIGKSELTPFFLPDTRADRQLRIDYGPSHYPSASFPADVIGEYSLKICQFRDPSSLTHITTRATAEYDVSFPPNTGAIGNKEKEWDGELGIWFETDWEQEQILVKGTKRGKYSYDETNIHVGDVLLSIDGESVAGRRFNDVITLIREKLAEIADFRGKNKSLRKSRMLRGVHRPNVALDASFSSAYSGSDTFDQSMTSRDSMTLTFRTIEERMRLLREDAFLQRNRRRGLLDRPTHGSKTDLLETVKGDDTLNVEMRYFGSSIFLFVREFDKENPQYKILNHATNHAIVFRQRDCHGHPWIRLEPGESCAYTWEEPLKARKLTVKVGAAQLKVRSKIPRNYDDDSDKQPPFGRNLIPNEDESFFGQPQTVKFDSIGEAALLVCPNKGERGDEYERLTYEIEAEGASRVMRVASGDYMELQQHGHLEQIHKKESAIAKKHLSTVNDWIKYGERKKRELLALYIQLNQVMDVGSAHSAEDILVGPGHVGDGDRVSKAEEDSGNKPNNVEALLEKVDDHIKELDDQPEGKAISHTDQLFVEVLECNGLNAADLSGMSNPYCEVNLKDRKGNSSIFFRGKSKKKKTYFVEKNLSPKWNDQQFVFHVPSDARKTARRFFIRLCVKSYSYFGKNRFLGQADVELVSLKDQCEVVGWFSLTSMSVRQHALGHHSSGDHVRGSVKLRIQWIYSIPALLTYHLRLADDTVAKLKKRKMNMMQEIKRLGDSDSAEGYVKSARASISNLKRSLRRGSMGKKARESKNRVRGEGSRDGEQSSIMNRIKTTRASYLLSLNIHVSEKKWLRRRGSSIQNEVNFEAPSSPISDILEDSHDDDDNLLSTNGSFSLPFVDENFTAPIPRGRTMSDEVITMYSTYPPRQRAFTSSDSVADLIFDPLQSLPAKNRLMSIEDIGSMSSMDSIHRDIIDDESLRDRTIDAMYREYGLLYHSHGKYFHHDNLNCRKRPSASRAISERKFTSWVEAGIHFNQEQVFVDEYDQSKNDTTNNGIISPLTLPPIAPSSMKAEAKDFSCQLTLSRQSITNAAMRSFRSVLNQGGTLTITPITARFLPDASKNMCMHVVVSHGNTNVRSNSVKGVSPVWCHEYLEDNCSFGGKLQLSRKTSKRHRFGNRTIFNEDLDVEVHRLEANSTLRLSVMGSRKGLKKDIVLGVLIVPISLVTENCNEASLGIEEFEQTDEDQKLVRWFPLMALNESNPVEGDMGMSLSAFDTEKVNRQDFNKDFMPCIQIAFSWKPKDMKWSGLKSPSMELGSTEPPSAVQKLISGDLSYLRLDLGGVLLSLIDSLKCNQLLSLSLRAIDGKYSVSSSKTKIFFGVGSMQIDNQLIGALEPVILAPASSSDPQPALWFECEKDHTRSKRDVDSYDFVLCRIKELDVRIEERWLFNLWSFVIRLALKVERKGSTSKTKDHLVTNTGIQNSSPGKFLLKHDSIDPAVFTSGSFDRTRTKKVYIQMLGFDELKINLSYLKGSDIRDGDGADNNTVKSDDEFGDKHGNDSDGATDSLSTVWRASSQGARLSVMTDSPLGGEWSSSSNFEDTSLAEANLPFVASGLIPSITDAPIKLSKRQIEHVFESSEEIIASLKKYFVEEIMRQIYIVIGSVDFVGNPTMIAKTIGTGVRDFFYQPYTSLLKSPNDLGIGVVKGTLSLVSHSAQGVFGLTSKMSSAVSKIAARASMDENFRIKQAQKFAARKNNAKKSARKTKKELAFMVIQPFEDVLNGAFSGVKGVFVEPYRGAKNGGGACGCLKGLSIGVIGTIVRPIAGIANAFNHVSNSVQLLASGINILEEEVLEAKRFRMPCVFGVGNRFLPFNLQFSISVDLIRNHPIVLSKKNDPLRKAEHILLVEVLSDYEPGVELHVVLSSCRMALFKKSNVSSHLYDMAWQIDLSIDSLHSEVTNVGHHSVELRVQTSPKSGAGIGVSLASRKRATSTNKHEIYKVRGKFQHRPKLLRLHNALCCLTGNFDNVVYERGLGPEWSSEGKVSFGYIQFESPPTPNKKLCSASKTDNALGVNGINEKGLLDLLESVSWEFLPTHNNEENARRSRMSPKWLVKACTTRMRNIVSSSLPPCAPIRPHAASYTLSSTPASEFTLDLLNREQNPILDSAKNDGQKMIFWDVASVEDDFGNGKGKGEKQSNGIDSSNNAIGDQVHYTTAEAGFEVSQPRRFLDQDEFGRFAQQGVELSSSRVSLTSHLSNSAEEKALAVTGELRVVRERVERMEMMLEQILMNTQASSPREQHVRDASISSTAHETQISRLTTDFPSADSKSMGLNQESLILKLIEEVEDLKSQVAESQLQSTHFTIENESQNSNVIHGAKRATRTSFNSSGTSNAEVKNEKKRRKYFFPTWKGTSKGSFTSKERIEKLNVDPSLQETPGASNKRYRAHTSVASSAKDGTSAPLVAEKLEDSFVQEQGVETEYKNMPRADQTLSSVPEIARKKVDDATDKKEFSSEADSQNQGELELKIEPCNDEDWLALEALAGSDVANNVESFTDDWLKLRK